MATSKSLTERSAEPRRAAAEPLIAIHDASRALQIVVGTAIAWGLPERYWDGFAVSVSRLLVRLRHKFTAERVHQLQRIFGDRLGDRDRRDLVARNLAHELRAGLQRFRELSPIPWRPHIEVRGTAHIDAALENGHGVILWVHNFAHSDHLVKKGLWQQGYRLHHLSRPSHGFRGSRFGQQVLTPFWLRAESRHLAERIVWHAHQSAAVSRRLSRRLKDNKVVSITVGHVALKQFSLPFLECRLMLALGPPHLALSTKATLLPVSAIRTAAGAYQVTVEPPLEMPPEGGRQERMEAAAAELFRRLEPRALAEPEQYRYWRARVDD
ncbi:MAG: hypothetical protein QF893_21805 [Alphaproteobacteria bacterium]|jgi:lauroyl/myristoyl acyltransferase|nr:hypothetical protein [Alphaproteobacteria bacterium]